MFFLDFRERNRKKMVIFFLAFTLINHSSHFYLSNGVGSAQLDTQTQLLRGHSIQVLIFTL